jgi:hypothetical protein
MAVRRIVANLAVDRTDAAKRHRQFNPEVKEF